MNKSNFRWTKCTRCIGEHPSSVSVQRRLEIQCVCKGTRLKFPSLSFDCSNSGNTLCPISLGLKDKTAQCSRCDNRGRRPIDTLEGWMDAIEVAGYLSVYIEVGVDGNYDCVIMPRQSMTRGKGETRLDALQDAFYKTEGFDE